ncbi:hypothetical protein [Glaesserella parasuis]|uniref:hypothetical protein n=1 Tax=Glaesserella parasuis TaxID=738 RepID=UPI003853227E
MSECIISETGIYTNCGRGSIDGITKMFPEQKKIELFARKNYIGWDNWGLEIPESEIEIYNQGEFDNLLFSSSR